MPSGKQCQRKETWERLRRLPGMSLIETDDGGSVWVKRESVHTQTSPDEPHEAVDSSSDSLPRAKPPRPNNLPLGEHFQISNYCAFARLSITCNISLGISRGD